MSERKVQGHGWILGVAWNRWSLGICWKPGWFGVGIGPVLLRKGDY